MQNYNKCLVCHTLNPNKNGIIFILKRLKNVIRAKLNQEVISEWKLAPTSVNVKSETVHLGFFRSENLENNVNISDVISLTRRTLYALIRAGDHGNNDSKPKV